MKNIYSISKDLVFKYYPNIALIENLYKNDIQDCFNHSYLINDIDIINGDKNYLTYISKEPILLIFKDNCVLGFIVFKYLKNIKALDFNTYVNSTCNVTNLKNITQEGMLIYSHIAKDLYPIEMFYFNIASKLFYQWLYPILKTGTLIKIRPYYYICYGNINKEYIENIILKDIEISC